MVPLSLTSKTLSPKRSIEIHNDKQEMDDNDIVRFTDLRFSKGSRKKMMRIQFFAEVQYVKINGQIGTQMLESDTSQSFIILTNENQWKDSECHLLRKHMFELQGSEISWWRVCSFTSSLLFSNRFLHKFPLLQFANTLQIHYLRATRQDPTNCTRPLSMFLFIIPSQ